MCSYLSPLIHHELRQNKPYKNYVYVFMQKITFI